MPEDIRAVLTVYDPADMTRRERDDVADWLRGQASQLVAEGVNYDDRYRAKYYRARYVADD